MMMTLNKRFYTVDFCAFCNFARCIALDLCAKRYNDTSAGVRTEDGGWLVDRWSPECPGVLGVLAAAASVVCSIQSARFVLLPTSS